MKKFGFTLAEVLITLTIIGVIAALTLPNLTTNINEAQIAPKLAKAKASFEQANAIMLNNNSVDLITELYTKDKVTDYKNELSKTLKSSDPKTAVSGLASGEVAFETPDGMVFTCQFTNDFNSVNTSTPAYKQKIGKVTIDIDGNVKKGKTNSYNRIAGVDLFTFSLYNDGTLVQN